MYTLYLLNYNNYANRVIKGFSSIEGYEPYLVDTLVDVNFNPADGVVTSHVCNTLSGDSDYLLVTQGDSIVSRWFILDADRTRLGQYNLTLKRDVIYDNLNAVMNAPSFIQKGYISDINNPLIYNDEALRVNQIKQEELLLKDKTGCPWIVGYLGRNNTGTETPKECEWTNEYSPIVPTDREWQLLNSPNLADLGVLFRNTFTVDLVSRNAREAANLRSEIPTAQVERTKIAWDGGSSVACEFKYVGSGTTAIESAARSFVNTLGTNGAWDAFRDNVRELHLGIIAPYSEVSKFKGKVVSYNNETYKVSFTQLTSIKVSRTVDVDEGEIPAALVDAFNNSLYIDHYFNPNITANDLSKIYYSYSYTVMVPELTPTKMYALSTTIPVSSNRNLLANQPYSIFCMPLPQNGGTFRFDEGEGEYVDMTAQTAIQAALAVSRAFTGSGGLYDIQILPYCPVSSWVTYTGDTPEINLSDIDGGEKGYTPITTGTGEEEITIGYLLWAQSDSFTVETDIGGWVDIVDTLSPVDFKVKNQAEKYRLCSPNYASVWEFTGTKNMGILDGFNADCTYRPYSPYIRVYPAKFGGLYGDRDWGDSRGLICGGDFSMPQIIDQWQTYEINNKNYENSFNRQVQSLELTQKQARTDAWFGAVSNTVSSGVAGGISGAKGGVAGAIAGAAIGTVAGGAGATIDLVQLYRRQNDQLGAMADQFNYSLQNIQARPMTISKVGAIDINNKMWPFLERYDCTDTEKEAIRSNLHWNGMTVGVIGKLSDYLDDPFTYKADEEYEDALRYIKAQIIHLGGIQDDYHMANEIKDEVNAGFYWYQENEEDET